MMSEGNSSDFLLGMLVGCVVGLALLKGKKKFDLQMLEKAFVELGGKGASKKERNVAEVLEWAYAGIELWKKYKKRGKV